MADPFGDAVPAPLEDWDVCKCAHYRASHDEAGCHRQLAADPPDLAPWECPCSAFVLHRRARLGYYG